MEKVSNGLAPRLKTQKGVADAMADLVGGSLGEVVGDIYAHAHSTELAATIEILGSAPIVRSHRARRPRAPP